MARPKQTDPQFKLRLTPELKGWIEKAAEANSRTMNAEILDRLQSSFATLPGTREVIAFLDGSSDRPLKLFSLLASLESSLRNLEPAAPASSGSGGALVDDIPGYLRNEIANARIASEIRDRAVLLAESLAKVVDEDMASHNTRMKRRGQVEAEIANPANAPSKSRSVK